MAEIYKDPDHVSLARIELVRLTIDRTQPFNDFYAEFDRLTSIYRLTNNVFLRDKLLEKISSKLYLFLTY